MGLSFTVQHSGLRLLEPGNHLLEGAVLSLLFFAVAIALPISLFLARARDTRTRPLSMSCLAAAVYTLSASGLGTVLISSSIIWQYFALISLCLLPAGICAFITRTFPADASALHLHHMSKILVIYAVGTLLGVAANVAPASFFLSFFFGLLTVALLLVLLVLIKVIRAGENSAEPILLCLFAVLVTGLIPAIAEALHLNFPFAFPVLWGILPLAAGLIFLLRAPKPIAPARSHSVAAVKTLDPSSADRAATSQNSVSSFTHEINHPLGTGLLVATHLQHELNELQDLFRSGDLKKSDLEKGIFSYKEAVDIIITNLQNAADTVQAFKNEGSAGSPVSKQVFSVDSHCRKVLQGLTPRIRQAGHQLHYTCQENITISSYPLFFTQIISNLVINSLIHAYPSGATGILTLEITAGPAAIQLKYSDDGKGIAKEHLPQIFEPRFTTNEAAGNTGLGLSTVHSLVTERLGGSIDCASTPGKGTTFTITLPVERR